MGQSFSHMTYSVGKPAPLQSGAQSLAFTGSAVRIHDAQLDNVFYVYPDKLQAERYPIPKTLEEAYGNGFLVIEAHSPGIYYLRIGNMEWKGPMSKLECILHDWALSEGYTF